MRQVFFLSLIILSVAYGCRNKNDEPAAQQQIDTTQTGDLQTPPSKGSVYQMVMDFENQYGKKVAWSSLKGKVQVMAMIFTHCEYACPRITQDIREIEKLIPAEDKGKVQYTLISFDVKRDTPPRLLAYYKEKELDSSWLLLHGSEENVQMVGAMLDVKFKPMEDGLFSHENVITILNQNGEIVVRREGLGKDPKEIAGKVKELVR